MSFPQLRSGWRNPLTQQQQATVYTIVAESGTYVVTGSAASLEWHRKVAANGGTYSVTGTAASLEYNRRVVAASGSYVINGTAASLEYHHEVAADPGSYLINGTAADLIYSAGASALGGNYRPWQRNYPRAFHPAHRKPFRFAIVQAYSLTADSGSYVLTGTAATLTHTVPTPTLRTQQLEGSQAFPRPFAPGPWGQLRSSRSVNRIGFVTVAYALAADSGSYVVTGTAANLEQHRKVVAAGGSYALTGTAASLEYHHKVVAASGSYVISGTAASLELNRRLIASPGAYTVTGTAANLTWSGAATVTHRGLRLRGRSRKRG